MNILQLRLDEIEMGQRLRAVDEGKAELIAASFREIGQQMPIQVRPKKAGKYPLITGQHRYRAAQLAELQTVLVVVRDVPTREAELIEVDENLLRADLSVLERGGFLAKRKELYLSLHPEAARGGDRKSDQRCKLAALIPETFSDATAERLGLSGATIDRLIRYWNGIKPAAREKLSGTPFADKGAQLKALQALQSEADQIRAVELVLSKEHGAPRSLQDAVDAVRGIPKKEKPSPDEKAYIDFVTLWGSASAKAKGRIEEHIAAWHGARLDKKKAKMAADEVAS